MNAKKIVRQNFRGLDSLIEDKELLWWYKGLIADILKYYVKKERKKHKK